MLVLYENSGHARVTSSVSMLVEIGSMYPNISSVDASHTNRRLGRLSEAFSPGNEPTMAAAVTAFGALDLSPPLHGSKTKLSAVAEM